MQINDAVATGLEEADENFPRNGVTIMMLDLNIISFDGENNILIAILSYFDSLKMNTKSMAVIEALE